MNAEYGHKSNVTKDVLLYNYKSSSSSFVTAAAAFFKQQFNLC